MNLPTMVVTRWRWTHGVERVGPIQRSGGVPDAKIIGDSNARIPNCSRQFTGSVSHGGLDPDADLLVLAHDADRANFGMSTRRRVGKRS